MQTHTVEFYRAVLSQLMHLIRKTKTEFVVGRELYIWVAIAVCQLSCIEVTVSKVSDLTLIDRRSVRRNMDKLVDSGLLVRTPEGIEVSEEGIEKGKVFVQSMLHCGEKVLEALGDLPTSGVAKKPQG